MCCPGHRYIELFLDSAPSGEAGRAVLGQTTTTIEELGGAGRLLRRGTVVATGTMSTGKSIGVATSGRTSGTTTDAMTTGSQSLGKITMAAAIEVVMGSRRHRAIATIRDGPVTNMVRPTNARGLGATESGQARRRGLTMAGLTAQCPILASTVVAAAAAVVGLPVMAARVSRVTEVEVGLRVTVAVAGVAQATVAAVGGRATVVAAVVVTQATAEVEGFPAMAEVQVGLRAMVEVAAAAAAGVQAMVEVGTHVTAVAAGHRATVVVVGRKATEVVETAGRKATEVAEMAGRKAMEAVEMAGRKAMVAVVVGMAQAGDRTRVAATARDIRRSTTGRMVVEVVADTPTILPGMPHKPRIRLLLWDEELTELAGGVILIRPSLVLCVCVFHCVYVCACPWLSKPNYTLSVSQHPCSKTGGCCCFCSKFGKSKMLEIIFSSG